jgi:ssDNA thymidine ADP-ribosyltransferase, DarT
MTPPAEQRWIFHITHFNNLPAILADGCLWSDYEVSKLTHERTVIGFDTIKKRRLEELSVTCHPATFVGQYVPFYFCPRSPMLFVIHKRNPELRHQEGQERIVHLVSRIDVAIQVADGRPWAFTDGNAGARYTSFSNDITKFENLVDWKAVKSHYWSDPTIKERKQAEFLVHTKFPWTGILAVGTINDQIAAEVERIVATHSHRPKVIVKRDWYY